jgi:hypothetical protein
MPKTAKRLPKYPGLKCPECGSWYSNDPTAINLGYSVGDVCGNQAMTGPHPERCSPEHPCRGRLVPAEDTFIDPFNLTKEQLAEILEYDDEDE